MPDPQRHLLSVPLPVLRMTSPPHDVVFAPGLIGAPPPLIVCRMSCRPTSRPTTKPAPNPTTETRSTTPVPSTQVRVAGLIHVTVLSSTLAADTFFFLAARWDFAWEVEAALLPFSSLDETDAGALCALELDVVRVVGWRVRGDDFGAADTCTGDPPGPNSDSGTSLSSIGWLLGPTPAPMTGSPWDGSAATLRLPGRLLAAAAQERRVVSDARRAASLSA